MTGRTITRADLCEAVYRKVGLSRAESAELVEMLIDEEDSVAGVVAEGFERETVKKVERLIYLSEYKRFQSAPGARLTSRAFWLDRRYPIVNRWRDES